MRKSDQEKVLNPWIELLRRSCWDYTGLGIGWGDDAQDKFGEYRIELVTFGVRTKEELAYPVRNKMEDRKVRIPFDPDIRSDLRAVTKTTTAAGNVRFTAERSEDGHADRFWALALAIQAAGAGGAPAAVAPVDDESTGYHAKREGRLMGRLLSRINRRAA